MTLPRLPKSAIVVRQHICAAQGCQHGPLDFSDPCTACPEGRWGVASFRCGRPETPQVSPCAPPAPIAISAPTTGGPGTELKAMLGKVGLKSIGGCQCDARARLMDQRGPEWCERHIETIVGWLREEAERRNLPFIAGAARLVIRRAIRKAQSNRPA